MDEIKKIFKIVLAYCMTVIVITLPTNVGTYALPELDVDNKFKQCTEDSDFVLSKSNVQIEDENYYPETADIFEQEAYENSMTESGEMSTFTVNATVGDSMVYLTQKWLNQEYGNVPGFGSVTENGKTGWNVIYGLTRALQYELGITSLTNNFGPTTKELYEQNLLHRQDGVTDRKFAILQGALWCKGYNPGYYLKEDPDTGIVSFQEIFNSSVEDSVIKLKKDAGLINPDGVVTTNLMRALLSMDAFKLLGSYYGGKSEVRAMQQRINRKYEAYTGLVPCDGVYGRNTNKALIFAFQAEEGLPVGVATGSFKATTKSLAPQIPYVAGDSAAKNYQGNYYSNANISALTEILQFVLYINGYGDGNFDGVYSSVTKQAVMDFQQFYALPKTGIVDIDTWMSLLLSSGNTDRSAIAADCATILNEAKAKTLYDNGYRYIGRYLTGTYAGGLSKALTVEEANIIFDAGLRFFPIYQSGARSDTYFTSEQGTFDAKAAIAAANALGIPKDTIIYFAVDFDSMDYQITNNVIPYFEKVFEEISQSNYKTGIYGARNVCSRVSKEGYSCSSFVGDMSTGFSGNLGFKIPDNWAFSQFANCEGTKALGSGDGRIEIDKDAFSGRDQGVGKLNTTVKKAIYILPGYLASKLYDGPDGAIVGNQLWSPEFTLTGIANFLLPSNQAKFMQSENSSGTGLHVDYAQDQYGAMDAYKTLVERLESDFDGDYDINFFPYNWLEDLNDSVNKLEKDIQDKRYSEVVFVTHSTGGLLASAFISKSNVNKLKVKKAILIAAPLFGTYASLFPLERGDSKKLLKGDAMAAVIDLASNNEWVRGWAKNSPTTYQLLPSDEYLKYYPLIKTNQIGTGKEPILKISGFYDILNQSENINPLLTTDSKRSHKYFRETILKNNVVNTLQQVDTLLIGTESGHWTPSAAVYKEILFGTGKKLKDIEYNKQGDGTVQSFSAKAERKGSSTPLKIDFSYSSGHSDLVSDSEVLNRVSSEISGLNSATVLQNVQSNYTTYNSSYLMNGFIKIRYEANAAITAKIYDSSNNIAAQITENGNTGFDDEKFIYDSFADSEDITDASIYMPNNGYKIVFAYGNQIGTNINFIGEVSTLDNEGYKDISCTKSVSQTLENGLILSIDGVNNTISNDNISNIISGTVQNNFTNWELPDIIKINMGDKTSIDITGNDALNVFPLLEWFSADESIVTVSSTGALTACDFGRTTVSASAGNKSCVCEVVVVQDVSSVTVSDLNMVIGEKALISPTFFPANATETAMTYTYDKGGIISIDEYGTVSALAAGVVNVIGVAESGATVSFIITVRDPDFTNITGDVNSDNTVDIRDLVRLKKHIAGSVTLIGPAFKAADIDNNGSVTSADLVLLRKILLGVEIK